MFCANGIVRRLTIDGAASCDEWMIAGPAWISKLVVSSKSHSQDANAARRCRKPELVDHLAGNRVHDLDRLHAIGDVVEPLEVRGVRRPAVAGDRAVSKLDLADELLRAFVEEAELVGPNPHDERPVLGGESGAG